MRLIAWNVNYNSQKRSLEDDIAMLRPLAPDVMVLSETAPPAKSDTSHVTWIGNGAPGLAVVVNRELEVLPHAANHGAPSLMGCFSITGRVNFELLAIWPIQRSGVSYHQILMAALDRYSEVFSTGRAIMAGDFNSSTRVVAQKSSHPQFVMAAESRGLVSTYHARTGEAHGEESTGTYRHGFRPDREFHIDYCFLPKELASSASLTVLWDGDWAKRSDHFPLVLDLPDMKLAGFL
ncbi:MAG: endonuclease/exonuclease/phosphatase family protein [Pirellulaceae bacterium]